MHSESKSASFNNLEAIEEDNDEECETPRNIQDHEGSVEELKDLVDSVEDKDAPKDNTVSPQPAEEEKAKEQMIKPDFDDFLKPVEV